ncbi:MAG TPA: DNA polymerase I [Porphyromonadaceae bacterium]|nr:DNA polymerase I [Porphyromonadaceae bacterium]
MDNQRLFLLDAFALIFRAYYALIKMPRVSSAGFNTSAIFGFVNTLEELLRKEKPTHLAVCFDPAGPTFRHLASEEYKSERAETPEDIKLSIPYIKRIIEAYNIPVVVCDGFEADDVIGTLARQAEQQGFTTYMMTPDKDFGQLVTPHILQYKPGYRGGDFEVRGPEEICARYGLQRTAQVIDLLALMGDKIDNIPGCPGVGEKTAQKLIAEYGSVEHLLEDTSALKGALKRKVEENAEQIRFSKFLATIRTDAPVTLDADAFRVCAPDTARLFPIFDELEFRTLRQRVAKRLDDEGVAAVDTPKNGLASQPSLFDFDNGAETEAAAVKPVAAASVEVQAADSPESVERLRKELESARRVAVVAECDGDSDMTAALRGFSLAFDSGTNWRVDVSAADALRLVWRAFERPDVQILSADCKRDYVLARRMGGDAAGAPLTNFLDIPLAHYLLQPELRHDIPTLAEVYLHRLLPDKDASAAARAVLDLTGVLMKELDDGGLRWLYDDLELPLLPVLAEMEYVGVAIDVPALNAAAGDMRSRIAALEQKIYELSGTEFNIGSPSQVGEVLFDRLKLDAKAKKTKSGQYSTTEEILQKLVPLHPVVGKILKHRSLRKLLSTYLMALPQAINPATGRVHTTYNQTVTATGRISSSNPNLQNIPVRDDEGREIRRAFIASNGRQFISADYSQIELRLVADFAGEQTMVEAFREGKDIHAITASRIYGVPLEEVTADQRRHAKTANFGILYGISAFGLASRLGISRAAAKELIDGYFTTFPAIRDYMDRAVEDARRDGVVRTAFGRRRFLPDINSKNPVVRGYAERNAINAPIQGTAADIIKKAMVDIDRELRDGGFKTQMIMQVHDELNFDVVPEELDAVRGIVERCMQGAYSGAVPLTASIGVASNWLDAH